METSDLIKKVRKIEIKTRGISAQLFSGQYHSAFKGRGMAFTEVREYYYGDDIRSIDWNVTARFNHPYVKVFEEEREMTVMLLIDVSGSNEFGASGGIKEEIITEIAAVLAFSAISNNDKVGVIFFSDKIEKFIPPKKGTTHILHIIRELINFKPESKGTDLAMALKYLRNVIKKRSIAFVLSDFQDDNYADALSIVAKKHDLICLHIYDEREFSIPKIGIMKLHDAESGNTYCLDTSSNKIQQEIHRYNKKLRHYMREAFTRAGVDSSSISSNEDYIPPLMKLFKKRSL